MKISEWIKKQNAKSLIITTLSVAGITTLDLASKNFAENSWSKFSWFPLREAATWLEFGYSKNTGIAFGLPLTGSLLVTLNIILVIAFIIYAFHSLDFRLTSAKLTVGLILGGSLGNLIDRLTLGAVRDFLRIGFWPMFNIADTAIVVGVALIFFHFYNTSHDRKI